MGIRDNNIDWLRKTLFIPHIEFGLHHDGSTPFNLEGPLAAGTFLKELGSLGYVGLLMDANGENVRVLRPLPKDIDPISPIGFRVHWTALHDGAGDAAATWTILTRVCKRGIAIAAAATALDTVVTIDQYTNDSNAQAVTDYLYQRSPRGIMNSLGITRTDIESGALLLVDVDLTTMDADFTECYLIGLEIDYVPWKTEGQGSNYNRPELHTGVR